MSYDDLKQRKEGGNLKAYLPAKAKDIPVLAESNGHHWIQPELIRWQCCRDCGIVRRADDKNSPCKGKAKITLRAS